MLLRVVLSYAAATTAAASMGSGECVAPTPLGCFQDPFHDPAGKLHRVLTHVAATADPKMTPFRCVALCCEAGFGAGAIAGVEAGSDCRCDHGFGPYTIPKSTGCNVTCSGSAGERCGGIGAVSAMSISECPAASDGHKPAWHTRIGTANVSLQQCGAAGCTSCPKEDTVRHYTARQLNASFVGLDVSSCRELNLWTHRLVPRSVVLENLQTRTKSLEAMVAPHRVRWPQDAHQVALERMLGCQPGVAAAGLGRLLSARRCQTYVCTISVEHAHGPGAATSAEPPNGTRGRSGGVG